MLARFCGLTLAGEKLQVWTPDGTPPPPGLRTHWSPHGIVLLGGPLDARDSKPFVADDQAALLGDPTADLLATFLNKRLAHMRAVSELICELPHQAPAGVPALHIAFLLLHFCVAPKVDHLFRLLPPAATQALAHGVDRLLLEKFSELLGVSLSWLQARQLRLRVADGGLGLLARGGAYPAAAYVSAWALSYHAVSQVCGCPRHWRVRRRAPLPSAFGRQLRRFGVWLWTPSVIWQGRNFGRKRTQARCSGCNTSCAGHWASANERLGLRAGARRTMRASILAVTAWLGGLAPMPYGARFSAPRC